MSHKNAKLMRETPIISWYIPPRNASGPFWKVVTRKIREANPATRPRILNIDSGEMPVTSMFIMKRNSDIYRIRVLPKKRV